MRFLVSLCLCWLCAVAPSASAQQRIVAIVNDQVISALDFDARLRLMMSTSGLPDTPEIRQRVSAQVLRSLVDERLQAQEAGRLGVAVTDPEIAAAIQRIEQSNRMPAGQLAVALRQAGVTISSLEDQLRTAIGWQKLVQRRLRPQVEVAEEEIDETLERLQSRRGAPEFLLSEIFLPLDTPDQDDEVRLTATSLIQQMQRGTPFPAIAQQFSRSASAASGGDIGWVQDGQLDTDLETAIKSLRPGEVTPPLRVAGGYYIFGVRGRRVVGGAEPDDAVVTLTQIVFPARNPSEAASAEQAARTLRETARSCADLAAAAQDLRLAPPTAPQRLRVGDVNPAIRDRIRALKVGEPSDPIRAGAQVVVLMSCTREEAPSATLPPRDVIEDGLLRQRLDLLARRYLRDLRRQAHIDIRS
jgi:peptidyl-prolyl cis-trans isomerase SurA